MIKSTSIHGIPPQFSQRAVSLWYLVRQNENIEDFKRRYLPTYIRNLGGTKVNESNAPNAGGSRFRQLAVGGYTGHVLGLQWYRTRSCGIFHREQQGLPVPFSPLAARRRGRRGMHGPPV